MLGLSSNMTESCHTAASSHRVTHIHGNCEENSKLDARFRINHMVLMLMIYDSRKNGIYKTGHKQAIESGLRKCLGGKSKM